MTVEQERQSAALMRLAQDGDQMASASLLVSLTAITRRFARARLGDVPWIDDVIQETLLAVHGARQTYDRARPFAPWFYAIAANRLIDVLRRERRVTAREIPGNALPVIPIAGAKPGHEIDVQAIHRALASPPAASARGDRGAEVPGPAGP